MKKIFAIFVLGIIALTGCSSSPGEYDSFAQCLTENGATMYGTDWCSHCKDQKELFGNSFEYVFFVDCDTNKNACIGAGIRGYPTWLIEGELYSGTRSLEFLADKTGCNIIEEESEICPISDLESCEI